jgi:hypothetical protein
VYWFANGGDQEVYIGSADLMERNLDRRVEVLCPVRNRMIAGHIRESILRAYLMDNDRAYVLEDDQYHRTARPAGEAPISAQQILLDTISSARTTASADDATGRLGRRPDWIARRTADTPPGHSVRHPALRKRGPSATRGRARGEGMRVAWRRLGSSRQRLVNDAAANSRRGVVESQHVCQCWNDIRVADRCAIDHGRLEIRPHGDHRVVCGVATDPP